MLDISAVFLHLSSQHLFTYFLHFLRSPALISRYLSLFLRVPQHLFIFCVGLPINWLLP